MKNILNRPITRFGMPYHGLVTDGTLTTPGGPITINHNASVEGARVFKTRNPPGNNPDAQQALDDTANGWDWRDYAIINGWYNSIGDGNTQLGLWNFLYCDDNDVVWDMRLDYAGVGDNFVVELKRTQPFGRFYFGFDRGAFTEEVLATWTVPCYELSWKDGVSTMYAPAWLVANNMIMNSASIIPNIHGDTVHLHALSEYEEALPETYAIWNGIGRCVFATCTLNLSGAGDLDNDGVGISCSITNSTIYPDMLVRTNEIPADPQTIDPWPLEHYTFPQNNCQAPNVPTGPGQFCTWVCESLFTHEGETFRTNSSCREKGYGDQDERNEVGWTNLFDLVHFHGGLTCKVLLKEWETNPCGENYVQLVGSMTRTYDYESFWNGNNWVWNLIGQTDDCNAYEDGYYQYRVFREYNINIGGNTDSIDASRTTTQNTISSVEGACGCQTTGAPSGSDVTNWTFSEGYTINDTWGGSVYYNELEMQLIPIIYPGIVGYVIKHLLNPGTAVRHRGKLFGIGSDNSLTQLDSWDVTEVDTTIRFPWTSVAWQPETKQFNVQTDGATLVKYI